ncbi:hypothetical protein LC593_10015 [Nostoc sp. CHAB 5844]|nr:hypothetical protein [Nostoc sp. CHAB 5844]
MITTINPTAMNCLPISPEEKAIQEQIHAQQAEAEVTRLREILHAQGINLENI